MELTKEDVAQYAEGVKQGADDAVNNPKSDLDALRGNPYFGAGYLKGYSLVCRAIDGDV